jgi:hypothetical protein
VLRTTLSVLLPTNPTVQTHHVPASRLPPLHCILITKTTYSNLVSVAICPAGSYMPLSVAYGYNATMSCCKFKGSTSGSSNSHLSCSITTLTSSKYHRCLDQRVSSTSGPCCLDSISSVGATCTPINSSDGGGFCFATNHPQISTGKNSAAITAIPTNKSCCVPDLPTGCILAPGTTTGSVELCINAFQSICYDPYEYHSENATAAINSSTIVFHKYLRFCGAYTLQINKVLHTTPLPKYSVLTYPRNPATTGIRCSMPIRTMATASLPHTTKRPPPQPLFAVHSPVALLTTRLRIYLCHFFLLISSLMIRYLSPMPICAFNLLSK